jgi:site-specific recombinase XerC
MVNHPLPFLTSADVKLYAHMRKSGELVNVHKHTKHKIVGVSSKTINNELGILKDMVDEAVALGMVDTNVAREVNLPQKNNKIRRTLNRNEICKLLETAEIHRHLCRGYAYEIIMFGLFTGMRRAELRTLCWSDVDLETGKIAIQAKEMKGEHNFTTKSGVADTITIPDKLIPTIEGMSHSGRFVFGGDKPVSAVAISSGVKSIMTKAGFPKDVSLHHLRHTFGSWLLKTTGNLSHVKEAMRHLDIATTKLYMHTVAEDNDPTKSFDYE